MANQDSKLKVAELDFDKIKTNLKAFLKSQSEFSDYNFEGSGMSVLLDVLAYNTHYLGYYMNMMSNEMFLDTALMRQSVVSHAKLLGYTPRSRTASKATVNVSFDIVQSDANSVLTIPRFSRFVSAEMDGASYIFVNPEQTTVSKNSAGGFFISNLEIKEGQPQGYTFTYDSQTNTKQIFELPDEGIDTSTLKVQIQVSNQNATKTTFTLAQDSTEVAATSNVFYLEENKNGKYQIYFGDDIIGKKLEDGNIVIVTYLVASGTAANGIKSFKFIDTVPGYTSNTYMVVESISGKFEEDIEEIAKKFDREEEEEGSEGGEEEVPTEEPVSEPTSSDDDLDENMSKLNDFINTPMDTDEIDLSKYSDLGSVEETMGQEDGDTQEIDLDEIKNEIHNSISNTLSKYFK